MMALNNVVQPESVLDIGPITLSSSTCLLSVSNAETILPFNRLCVVKSVLAPDFSMNRQRTLTEQGI